MMGATHAKLTMSGWTTPNHIPLPHPPPPTLPARSRDEILAILDGYLLTGGGDLDPATFNEPPHPTLFEVAPARDRLEIALVGFALKTHLRVNSMHHQAVKTVGRGLVPVAFPPDTIIEGVELEEPDRFVLGVQWHPEELTGRDPSARRLFSALVAACRQ